ncbi:MAG: helix-turn-helix domain-containing protein [Dorea sp.]
MKSVDPGILPQSVCFSFTPSELAKQLYFYPTWCGHYYCTDHYFMKRDYYEPLLIVFVREGKFHIEYRDEIFDAEKGDVVLLDCREPHYYHAHNGLEFLYMHFDGSNSHEICQHILSQTGPLIRQDSNVLIGRLLYNMVDFYSHNGIESMFQSSMRIYHIFEYLLSPPEKHVQNDTPVEQAIHYIHDNIGKDISLEELAEIANLSPYYFAHKFKQQTGFAPMEYVINTRLDQAKILLARTSQSVAEIAYEVGYSSSGSLINIFQRKIRMSPSQYRKLHQMGTGDF